MTLVSRNSQAECKSTCFTSSCGGVMFSFYWANDVCLEMSRRLRVKLNYRLTLYVDRGILDIRHVKAMLGFTVGLDLSCAFTYFGLGFTGHRKGNTRFPATPPCCNRVLRSFMFAFHCVVVLCCGVFPKYVFNRTPGVSKSWNKHFMFPCTL